jgi:hypothetical protein
MAEGGHRLQTCAASAQAWPDEGTFATTVSNICSFIQKPSPAPSGTLSHAFRTGEREYCNDLEMGADTITKSQSAVR